MFDYNRSLLPNSHLAQLESGVATIDEARKKSGATSGHPGWGLLYHLLLSHLNREFDEVVLETGTNWGCSTIALAQALIDSGCGGVIHTFEINAENAAIARRNFDAAGVSGRINLHLGDSAETLPPVLDAANEIRTVFLDASHLYEDVKREFELILPSLASDALVLFDNTYRIADDDEDQRVNGFLRSVPEQYGGNLINLEFVSWFTPGFAMWQKQPNL
jgi:predicted O-methyltransferase YrrM